MPEEEEEECTRILFCGTEYPAAYEYTTHFLEPYPFIKLDVVPYHLIPSSIARYDVCVVRMMRFDSHLISSANRLKLLLQFGVGLDGVDVDAATEAGIKVARISSTTSGSAVACAEHAIYLTLGLLRQQKGLTKAVEEKRTGEPLGDTLSGKTVFILGYGSIGRQIAVRLRCFGVYIIATKRSWDANKNGDFDVVDERGRPNEHLDFARKADIVVTCCPLTSETLGVVNAEFLAAMKKGALLVNVGRGALLDYKAVRGSLESGDLGGLGMDVAWYEPFDPCDPVAQHPHVLVTPHIAGITKSTCTNLAKIIASAVVQLHHGKAMQGLEFVN